jgi:hypothetical protein
MQAHVKTLKRFKDKLKVITKRNRGASYRSNIETTRQIRKTFRMR